MWGAILSTGLQVGGRLLGGLFGRKSERDAQRAAIAQRNWAADREDTQIQRMAEDADAAGINRLVALRGGGSAGYAQTHMPILSGNAVATAAHGAAAGLAAGVQAAFDYNPLDEQRAMIEMELMQAQIGRINQDMALDTRLGENPTATGSRFSSTVPGGADTAVTLANGGQREPGRRMVTNPHNAGTVNPEYIDAEMCEARYGDMAQEVCGVRNAIVDTVGNIHRAWTSRVNGDNSYGGNASLLTQLFGRPTPAQTVSNRFQHHGW